LENVRIGEDLEVNLLPGFSKKKSLKSLKKIRVKSSLYSPYLTKSTYTKWLKEGKEV